MNTSPLIIFDTTLRDGEQSPGASMTLDEKVRIATALEQMQVDVIEAGFAAASEGDFNAVSAVANQIKNSQICSLARALDQDIEQAAKALEGATHPRIHTFIATSSIHMKHKLLMSQEQVIERAVSAIKKAKKYVDDVEFSCEDAGRSELPFLCQIIEVAINAGARTINIPDTVGYAVPDQMGQLIHQLMHQVPNADKAIFSVHCHNDLGLAVANSLAAVSNGARQIECTVNGLGERAGNAALEEIVMALHTRKNWFSQHTKIDQRCIVPTSKLVSGITGFPVQPNKAIVGVNAFAHEAGIHQDGVLKHRDTYEIMQAEQVGWLANRMVLGKHSGRRAFRDRLQQLNITYSSDDEFNQIFHEFKKLADRKHEIFDEDLQALANKSSKEYDSQYQLSSLSVSCNSNSPSKATIEILICDTLRSQTEQGSGPVDACFKAIERMVKSGSSLLLYSVNAITEGTDSQGEVTVRLEKAGRIVNGCGSDTDIITASARAYIDALNLLCDVTNRQHPQSI